MNPKDTALCFVSAVNAHDPDRLLALMTRDHIFIDAYGSSQSREEMALGWPGYFQWFPDYHIELTDILEAGTTVGLFGFAGGTYSGTGRRWRIPAAWKVVVDGDKVKVWQVFADSKIPYDSMKDEKDTE